MVNSLDGKFQSAAKVEEGEQGIDWSSRPYPPPWLLQTQRLIIRPYHVNDAPRVADIANHAEIAAWMTNRFPHPYTTKDSENFINHISANTGAFHAAGATAEASTAPPIRHFAICLREDENGTNIEHLGGLPIGGIGVDQQSDVFRRGAEMGYWLGVSYWGKGYMTEAVYEFVEWLFDLDDGLTGVEGESLIRVAAEVFGGNEKSTKVLERAGFVLEGRVKDAIWKNGEIRDLIILGLTRRQRDTKAAVRSVQG
jgi:ribosomal-protein-alanine N-acetyltransferase